MRSLLEAALAYAARGWPVFPCSPSDKRPLVGESAPGNGDAGLYRATTDKAQIRDWWTNFESAMIGVPTGARLGAFVIDIDPKDGTTPAQIVEALEAAIGCRLPPTPIVQTPRGGWHLYFRMPQDESIRNRAGLIPNVDVRGTGGYVVVPPSIRLGRKAEQENCAGVDYAWLENDALASFDPPLPPPELVDLILRRGKFSGGPDSTGSSKFMPHRPSSPHAGDQVRAYALCAFDSELARVRGAPEGTRNNTLNEAAFALGQLIGADALDELMITSALEAVASHWPDLNKSKGTIQSGLRAGKAQPRDLSMIRTVSTNKRDRRSTSRQGKTNDRDSLPTGNDDLPLVPPHDPKVVATCASLAYNDYGNARRLLRHRGENLLHVRDIGWHKWDGRRWNKKSGPSAVAIAAQETSTLIRLEAETIKPTSDEASRIEAAEAIDPALLELDGRTVPHRESTAKARAKSIKKDGERAMRDYEARRTRCFAWSISSGNAGHLKAMVNQAAPHCEVEPAELDTDPLAINVLNGTLRPYSEIVEEEDLECPDPDAVRMITRKKWRIRLDPHERNDRISKLMRVEYDPAAQCPKWTAFIERFQPNAAIRDYLQSFHGYALTGFTDEQIFLFNYGLGANGKTTFIEALASLMGSYAATLPAEALTGDLQRRGDQATPEFARLPGSRLVRCAELPRGQGFREHTLKLLTGGEPILVRHLHRDFFEMAPTFKAIGSGNDRPTIKGVDEGIWRRMKLVPWEVTIPANERRPMKSVLNEFQDEASGMLNWLLTGLIDYLEAGQLFTPPEIEAATKDYRESNDPVGEFLEACVERQVEAKVGARALYDAYVSWCRANSIRPFAESTFAKNDAAEGICEGKGSFEVLLGCGLIRCPKQPGFGPERYTALVYPQSARTGRGLNSNLRTKELC